MGVIRIIPPAEGAAPGADALGLTHLIDASLEDRGHRDRTLPPDHAWVCFSVAPGLARQGQLLCSVQAGARPDQGDACQAVHNRVLVENAQPTSGPGSNITFDIGGFSFVTPNAASAVVGTQVHFEDDGLLNNAATVNVNVDEDELTGLSTGITDNDATTTVATFTGAQIAGLVTAGAEWHMANNWSLMARFDGEFGNGDQTYTGTARLRYAW